MKYREGKVGKEDVIIFNVSDGFTQWTQRKNEYVLKKGQSKVDWTGTCNVTAYSSSLEYVGYATYSDLYPELKRFPDKLAKFICEDKEMDEFYKKKAPQAWAEWNAGKKDAYTPVEIHTVLAEGVNRFMGCNIARFEEGAAIEDIITEVTINRRPIVTSGKFSGLNHIVSLVGFVYRKKDVVKYLDDDNKFYQNVVAGLKVKPIQVILDDPWGQTDNYANNKVGDDSILTWNSFINEVKPLGNTRVKFAHFIKPAMATV